MMADFHFINAIWDFDGTLFDTYPAMLRALQETLQEFGDKTDSDALYKEIKTTSIGDVLKSYAEQHNIDLQALHERMDVLEKKYQPETPTAYPHAREILQLVSDHGANFLWTHRDRSALSFLTTEGMSELFTGIITASDRFPRKPDPKAINAFIAHYGLDPAVTVMIGDRPIDVEAGKNAGVHTIFFDVDGFGDSSNADAVVSDLGQIQNYFLDQGKGETDEGTY
ncbi:MAG: HAD-IA family hydrolase [Schleiferilactobacillus perolens]|uniref:HAD-IA family hydrolase n=1 Tax=Schleiferilactobacillus perolens TaxID=100468 RepID=UPI0039E9FBAD